jgi:hypothetical protein
MIVQFPVPERVTTVGGEGRLVLGAMLEQPLIVPVDVDPSVLIMVGAGMV